MLVSGFRLGGCISIDEEVVTAVLYDKKTWPQDITAIIPDIRDDSTLFLAHNRGIDQIDIDNPVISRKSFIGETTKKFATCEFD